MNKPGNKPSNLYAIVVYFVGLFFLALTSIFAFTERDAEFYASGTLAGMCAFGTWVLNRRYERRVRDYLRIVCTLLVLCLFAGCDGPSSQSNWNSWAENEIRALKRDRADGRDVDDLRERLVAIESQLKQPTQVLTSPADEKRFAALEKELAELKKNQCHCHDGGKK